jgi:hypothetical protein
MYNFGISIKQIIICLFVISSLLQCLFSFRNFHPYTRHNLAEKLHSVVERPGTIYTTQQKQNIAVAIKAPGMNSRIITASVIVDRPIEDVWSIITDYNNLATHVPNLVQSYLVTSPKSKGIRLFQEGAQNIIGFDFRASLVMDMEEDVSQRDERILTFQLVQSGMFSSFDGTWSVKSLGQSGQSDPKTELTYSVFVKPKGPVPVIALEWQIKSEVPVNLLAVKAAAERMAVVPAFNLKGYIGGVRDSEDLMDWKGAKNIAMTMNVTKTDVADWGLDETLGSYMVAS